MRGETTTVIIEFHWQWPGFDLRRLQGEPIQMEITALLHDCSLEGETGYAATCVEFPEANGQGESVEACIEDLRSAVKEILAYRREEAAQSLAEGERLETLQA